MIHLLFRLLGQLHHTSAPFFRALSFHSFIKFPQSIEIRNPDLFVMVWSDFNKLHGAILFFNHFLFLPFFTLYFQKPDNILQLIFFLLVNSRLMLFLYPYAIRHYSLSISLFLIDQVSVAWHLFLHSFMEMPMVQLLQFFHVLLFDLSVLLPLLECLS